MKYKVAALMVVILSICIALSAFAEDTYSFLDNMNLSELQALLQEVETRISAAKTADAENDPDNMGMWEVAYYVDEFKLPTDEKYIRNKETIEGTFSNSATTNSQLLVRFLIDKDDLAIMLYEYGRNQVKNAYSSDRQYYNVTMMDTDGTRHTLQGYIFAGGDRIFFSESDEKTILNALLQNGTVRFALTETKRSSDTYVFTIEDSSYFTNAYNSLMQ